ncbi:MAG: glycoside hydrolase family 16 protein [Pseudomonadota bacterium]
MKNTIQRLFLIAMVLGLSGCGGGSSPGEVSPIVTPPVGGLPADYTLVWADEFDVDGLPDPTRWDYDTSANSTGWYNNELQYYAAGRLENSQVANGKLIITARKEALTTMPDYGGQNYTSARLVTRGKASWTYGFMEIRAKLPCGVGSWPAIWMLGTHGTWPGDGEIDIMEQVGKDPTTIHGTIHTQSTFNTVGGLGNGSTTTLTDACTQFHNYQLTWTAQSLSIGVDNQIYHTYVNRGLGNLSWPFDNPQYLLLNIAIGGNFGGPIVDDNIFPIQMEVDYVRIYQKNI